MMIEYCATGDIVLFEPKKEDDENVYVGVILRAETNQEDANVMILTATMSENARATILKHLKDYTVLFISRKDRKDAILNEYFRRLTKNFKKLECFTDQSSTFDRRVLKVLFSGQTVSQSNFLHKLDGNYSSAYEIFC